MRPSHQKRFSNLERFHLYLVRVRVRLRVRVRVRVRLRVRLRVRRRVRVAPCTTLARGACRRPGAAR